MTNNKVFAGLCIGILLDKEGFNPNNWDIKESPADNLYTIKNLDDSVEFQVYFEEKDEGFPDTTYLYTKYVDGIAEDVEAKSIKECIELGQDPKEKYHDGWDGKETFIGNLYRIRCEQIDKVINGLKEDGGIINGK